MKCNIRLKTRLLVSALLLASSPLAFADGITAGTDITNTTTVNFTVGGNAQTAQNDDVVFKVDRLVTFSVVSQGGTSVTPNAQDQALEFLLTNTSNDVLDFGLSVEQPTGDDFDASSIQYYVEDGTTAGFQSGEDTLVTYIDELAADASVTVYVVGDIPISAGQGDTSDVILAATAQAGGTASTEGAALSADTDGDDPALVETVFDEAAGDATGDDADDGVHSDTGTYTVSSAAITVSKTMAVLDDPTGAVYPNAYPIPGATIIYCITVSNGAGAQTASDVIVSDPIPANTSYETGTIRTAASAVTCNAAAASAGAGVADATNVTNALGATVPAWDAATGADGTVTTNNGTVAASGATTTIFQVTVD